MTATRTRKKQTEELPCNAAAAPSTQPKRRSLPHPATDRASRLHARIGSTGQHPRQPEHVGHHFTSANVMLAQESPLLFPAHNQRAASTCTQATVMKLHLGCTIASLRATCTNTALRRLMKCQNMPVRQLRASPCQLPRGMDGCQYGTRRQHYAYIFNSNCHAPRNIHARF